jgi:cytosine deaminase
MTDRLFRNARLTDGRLADLAVRDGLFTDPATLAPDAAQVDLAGLLVLPGLVDGHIHLDKSFVGEGWQPHQPADSLRARLAVEKRLLAAAAPVAQRAEALIALAYGQGTIAMRSHVDVDATTGLTNLHAVLAARAAWQDKVAIELVAFPQAGILTCPGTADILDAALREGAEVIGGIDPTELDGDAEAHLDIVFGLAERHGAKIDIHLHERGPAGLAQLRRIAGYTTAAGMEGRVTVSHAYALGDASEGDAQAMGQCLATAGIAILTNAPGDHAFPPVALLRAAGVEVFAGNDNIQDAWWPYGDGDMLRRAMLIGYRSGFYTDAALGLALDMATTAAARVLGLQAYGIARGNPATFLLLDAATAAAVVAGAPAARRLVLRGEMQPPPASRLSMIG